MKLQQLRYIVAIVKNNNHLSAAAEVLNTSQPGVSRQVHLLEQELGFDIFNRTRNRILGLTDDGEHLLTLAQRIVNDADAILSFKSDVASGSHRRLTIATTHTQARYVLPDVIKHVIKKFPDLNIVLKQGDPEEICAYVESSEADIAVGTETFREFPTLVQLPCFDLDRSIIAPLGHPILALDEITLEDIAKYPIITYDTRYSGRWKVMQAFKKAGLEPEVTLSAVDADVCKTYVELGLGIAILTSVTFDANRDAGLGARSVSHLLPSSTVMVTLRPNTFFRPYMAEFVRRLAPNLKPSVVRQALEGIG